MIRALLFLIVLVSPLHAVLWKDDSFGCAVNLPETAGWQPIQAGDFPGLAVLVSMQNSNRGAVFGITALTDPPSTNLRDPLTQQALEKMLQSFGYEWVGNSTVNVGGLEWRQYNVTAGKGAQATNGVVRYTVGNGRIFAVTLLVGGGKVAAQDLELQNTAGSFRLFAPVAGAPRATAPAVASTPAGPVIVGHSNDSSDEGPTVSSGAINPLYIGGGVAVVFIFALLFMSRGGKKSR